MSKQLIDLGNNRWQYGDVILYAPNYATALKRIKELK